MTDLERSITIVGAGYVGLVTAVGLATLGHQVELLEQSPDRLNKLRGGQIPIHEAGLQEAYGACLDAGRLTVADRHVGGPPRLVMICVGTPIDELGHADLSQMEGALRTVASVSTPETVLVIRSTLPLGSTPFVREWSGIDTSRTFTNPEFLRQGSAFEDFLHPTRVVIGQFPDADPTALSVVLDAVSGLPGPRMVVSVTEAELIKNSANAFLGLKLSFTNELAALSEEFGADVGTVLEGIGLDPRIGRSYMRPSFGFGGSCLPKELQTLSSAGRMRGLTMHVTTAASDANEALQHRFADRVERAMDGARGRRIALLGLAFKSDTDDVRASPALTIARLFIDRGAQVVGYDPAAGTNAARQMSDLLVVDDPYAALTGAHACVVATEWPAFRKLDWPRIRDLMFGRLIADGRRLLDGDALRDLGFDYMAVGRTYAWPQTPDLTGATAGQLDDLLESRVGSGPGAPGRDPR